jgi:hypothetical protein
MLPPLQTVVALAFGGWGLWLRNSILSRPFWGSTGWNSTAVFHVWPWPFRFAAILNMPAFLAGGLLARPLDSVKPRLPEWVSTLPVLLFVPLLWYWVGAWMDRNSRIEQTVSRERQAWLFLLLFLLVCAAAASVSDFIGSYTSWLLFGLAIWSAAGIGIRAIPHWRRRQPKRA